MQDFQIGQRITARDVNPSGLVNTFFQIPANPNRVGISIQCHSENLRVYDSEGKSTGRFFLRVDASSTSSFRYLSIKDFGQLITGTLYVESSTGAIDAHVMEYVTEQHLSQIMQGEL